MEEKHSQGMMDLYISAIIQARMGSSRLPGKVMKEVSGHPVLYHVIERVSRSRMINEVVVATTFEKEDLAILEFCAGMGIRVFAGSEEDVLDRYYQAAKLCKPDHVVRITADCPLHDPAVIDRVIHKHLELDNDYTSNTLEETFPDGLDCEIFTFAALEQAWKKAKLLSEREHVTPYIKKGEHFKKYCVKDTIDHSQYRWTLDTERDFAFICKIFEELYPDNPEFGKNDIYELLERCPDILEINKGIIRNEGYLRSLENDKIVTEQR
jgi:Spore coat polysaccharide biosynthesis protein F, CMP-KDO synthetase homolog